tara:strand:- start:88 stop:1701 length:1614 start_codon:yes stop_codon:yes gene_type:complete
MIKSKFYILLFIIKINLFFSCENISIDNNYKIFRYNESAGISSLDPAYSNTKSNIWAVNHIFNGLVDLDTDLNIIPSIAKSWVKSDDGLEYVFYLRDDVFFHKSIYFMTENKTRKVVASDFVYSFSRLKDENVSSPGRWVLDYFLQKDAFTSLNDTTLLVKLKRPFPSLLNILGMKYFSVVPEEVVRNVNFSKNPIGTGPFKFKYWKNNVKLVLLKNEYYFEFKNGERLPYLDAVNVSFINNPESLFINFLQSKIDFVSGHYSIFQEEFLTENGFLKEKYKTLYKMEKTPYLNTEYLAFNLEKCVDENNILAFINSRKALNYGFSRLEMIKYLRKNMVFPAKSGIVPSSLTKYNLNGFYYNLDTAKQLLSTVKINSRNLKTIDLYTTPDYLDICEYLQSSFSDLGINLNIKVNPPSIHRELVSNSSVCFFRGSWIADYPDPENYLQLFISKNKSPIGSNRTHFSNELFDSLYEKSFLIKNEKKRNNIFLEMEQILMDSAIIVPLYYDMAVRFISNKVNDFSINSMNLLSLKEVKKSN